MDKKLALETLKSFVENTDNVIAKDAILALHPELKESEDEKIRKAIGVALCGETAISILEANGTNLPDAIAYLEKQKEQKPAERNEDERIRKEIVKFIKDNTLTYTQSGCEIQKRWIDYLENHKEQKPVEYEKPLLNKFEQAVYDCAWGKVTCKPEGETQEEYAKRWAQQFLSMVRDWADDYIDFQIESAKRKAYNRGEADAEKPAEWSEEDEKMMQYIIGSIDTNISDSNFKRIRIWFESIKDRVQPKQEWSEGIKKTLDEISDYLKYKGREEDADFIRNLRPQPKAEWTIKDAKPGDILTTGTVTFIFKSVDKNGFVSMYCSYAVSTTGTNLNLSDTSTVDSKYVHSASIEQRREFLEELLRHMSSRSHWKPSVEQMEAFGESLLSVAYTENRTILQSLYNGLKSL